jgi:hypothetical protein
MTRISILKCLAAAGVLALSATQAVAATVTWATWSTPNAATLGSIGVTFSGEAGVLDVDARNWLPTSTWADGTIIPNAPVAGSAIRTLIGGPNAGVNTITFSQAVTNPVFAIWSLGQPSINANFTFRETPIYVDGGPSAEWGGSAITVAGNVVSGNEVNGSVIFYGTFNSLTWTNPLAENYYGFTVGINGGTTVIPVPAAVWLFGTGLMGMVAFSRRKRAAV